MIKLKIKYGNSLTNLRFPCTEKEMNTASDHVALIFAYGKNKPISVVQSFSRLASVVCLYTSPHTQLSTAKCPERFSLRALLRPMFCVHFVHNVKS